MINKVKLTPSQLSTFNKLKSENIEQGFNIDNIIRYNSNDVGVNMSKITPGNKTMKSYTIGKRGKIKWQ